MNQLRKRERERESQYLVAALISFDNSDVFSDVHLSFMESYVQKIAEFTIFLMNIIGGKIFIEHIYVLFLYINFTINNYTYQKNNKF